MSSKENRRKIVKRDRMTAIVRRRENEVRQREG